MGLLKREVTKQFLRFCLIGLETTILYYLIFILLFYFLKIHYLISAAAGFVIGVSVGFFFNRLLTFNYKTKSVITPMGYFLVNLFSLGFTMITLRFLVEFIGIYPMIAIVLLIPITTIINFLGIKMFVFKNKKW